MSDISNWSATAASNNAASPDGFKEGMNPSAVNNSAREVMAAIRRWYEDAQWINLGDTPTFATSTTFTLSGDLTGTYDVGRRIRCTDASTLYGEITASVYLAPNTTVTVSLDSGTLSASLSAVAVGVISGQNRAIAEQTGAEIKTLYEAEADTNAFTDAEQTKLSGIESGATADQTASEIRSLVESASDSNVFTDADHSKLNGIESGATGDQTAAEIRSSIYPASVANHVRAGPVQLLGDNAGSDTFYAETFVVEGAVESVGPTGSGADNIWAAMDILPTSARVMIADIFTDISTSSSTASGSVSVSFAQGDIPSPDFNDTVTRVHRIFDPNVIGDRSAGIQQVLIPLDSSQRFLMRWVDSSVQAGTDVNIRYRGFISD